MSIPKKRPLMKFEIKQEEKRKFHEKAEEILTTGDESRKKGLKAVAELEKQKIKTEADKLAERFEKSAKKRKFDDIGYLKSLREAAQDYILTIDPTDYPNWQLKLYITKGDPILVGKRWFKTQRGLLAILISPKNDHYAKGMTATFDPTVDVMGARGLGIAIEDTLDFFTGKMTAKEPKLWTSDKN